MKVPLATSMLLFLAVISCSNPAAEEHRQQEVPKALEDKSFSYEAVSKRGYDDLTEDLYKELAEKTPKLKELENQLGKLAKSKSDSLELFDKYNSKNEAFFNSANSHAAQIKDSLLRQKMRKMIADNLTEYNASISQHKALLKSIEAKNLALDDLYAALKVMRTLPIIAKYQKNNLPATKSMKGFYKQLDETTKYAETLTKQ